MNDPLREVLENLHRWRNLPSYQLERRFDVFLTPYLRGIVAAKVKVPLHDVIIPEMPLKQVEGNLTDKADYALFSADGRAAFLVELKTDCGSVRAKQDAYLLRAASRPWRESLAELTGVVTASKMKRKYVHLLHLLERAGQVQLDPALSECFREGAAARFRPAWVSVTSRVESVTALFITPRCMEGRACITFEDVRSHLAGRDEVLAPLLIEYLTKWEREAGSVAPDAGPVCE